MNSGRRMIPLLCGAMLVGLVLVAGSGAAVAQKPGGILRMPHGDSPASMSIHEESTIVSEGPMMAVFNNLVMFDQHIAQNRLDTIIPDLASEWSWSEDGTMLTFKLRQGVKWHDGKPFTAKDVKCTWDLLQGKAAEKLRVNPRKGWYSNLNEVTVASDYEAIFRLKRPQPALLALLASGWSPVYPCHVPARDMRQRPIGTGPFKFVEFKPNEHVKVMKNPDYWKPGKPYLDGIDWIIIRDQGTRVLSFVAGKNDLFSPYGVTMPLLRQIKDQAPQAVCEVTATNVNRTLIVNRDKPPFNNSELRRAMALTLDRQAFIDIIAEGKGDIGGTMLPGPEGIWGMPKEMLQKLPGYGDDIAKNRAEARAIMQKAGYGPDKRLTVTVSTRNIPPYRDPAVILIDQLKEIYIDAELEPVDTAQWYPKVQRKDYAVALNLTGTLVDDPDAMLYENYACGGVGNYNGYCNPEIDRMIEQQSMEADQEKRKRLVWEIERRLTEDDAKPLIYFNRGGICWDPKVKGLTVMVNSIYNGWRMEDIWLDQ